MSDRPPRPADPVTVRLRRTAPADLPHRARWMSDPATMAYNAGVDVAYPGYHRDTGCIDFPEHEWTRWLDGTRTPLTAQPRHGARFRVNSYVPLTFCLQLWRHLPMERHDSRGRA